MTQTKHWNLKVNHQSFLSQLKSFMQMDKDDHIESFNRTALIIICEDDIDKWTYLFGTSGFQSLGFRVLECSKRF